MLPIAGDPLVSPHLAGTKSTRSDLRETYQGNVVVGSWFRVGLLSRRLRAMPVAGVAGATRLLDGLRGKRDLPCRSGRGVERRPSNSTDSRMVALACRWFS